MPDQIFISYRRNDAAYVTGHINDLLRKEFGNDSVFTDVDNIALGVDFRAVLDESVSQCQVLLAVIGNSWLTVLSRDGKPRLHDPADFVRIEIESALKRNIPVIPLLVSGATMPLEEDLPDSLKDLAFRNGTQIRPAPDFNLDVDRLIRNLRAYLRSIRDDEQPAADTSGETEKQASQVDPGFGQDAETEQDENSREEILVGIEESARKQVELGIGHHPQKKRWATLLWPLAILAVAGGSWYYVDQNPEQFRAVLTAVQPSTSEPEENLVNGDSATSPADNAGAAGEATIGAPTSFSATTATDVGESPTANSTDSALPVDALEDLPADSMANTATDDDASPELATESTGEASDNALDASGDDADVTLTEITGEDATADDGMVDGEVVFTPGTQRRADVSKLLNEGVSLAADGDHEAAIEKFQEAIEIDADAAFLFKQRAASYRALGQHAAAVSDYDEAIRLNGEDINAYFNRGMSHFVLQDYAATVEDYDAVLQLDPEYADAYSKRADAHEALGNVGAAAQDRATAAVFQSNRDNPR